MPHAKSYLPALVETEDDALEGSATVEGHAYDFVLSGTNKGSSVHVSSVDDDRLWLGAHTTSELRASEIEVHAVHRAWRSDDDSAEAFQELALDHADVRMILAVKAVAALASGDQADRCPWCAAAGVGVTLGAAVGGGNIAMCASETRLRPIKPACTLSPDGTSSCESREDTETCEVTYDDKCANTCIQNC